MIDWLTLILDTEKLTATQRQKLSEQVDLIIRVDPNGETKDIMTTFHQLRSDTMGCTMSYSPNQLMLCGSPASLTQTNNVFGSMDILECFKQFRLFVFRNLGLVLPSDPKLYRCTRIDVTHNYVLNGQDEVNNALSYLKYANTRGNNCERRHSTVYWNKTSMRRSAKAYNKYLHAKMMVKKFKHYYSPEQLNDLKNILRLELKLGSQYLREYPQEWYKMTAKILQFEHNRFFEPVIGSAKVPTKEKLFNELMKVSPTENQGLAAFNTFTRITNVGKEITQNSMPRSTFYRHVKLLKLAGLSSADITSGEILPFRRQTIPLCAPVENWEQLNRAVGEL